jgi:DNA-binding response OmpR family regulator
MATSQSRFASRSCCWRASAWGLRADNVASRPCVLRAGDLTLALRTCRASVGKRGAELTTGEFTDARATAPTAARCSAASRCCRTCGSMTTGPRSNVVDVYVGYLRRKLGSDRFQVVGGMGYRIAATP